MGRHATATCEERLEVYIDELASVIGHADRVRPLHDYCVGLMLLCCNVPTDRLGCSHRLGLRRQPCAARPLGRGEARQQGR